MPTLGGGLYMDLKAEDGNRYPHPIEQYGLELPAAKTIDAIVNVAPTAPTPSTTARLDLMNGAATGGGMLVEPQSPGRRRPVDDPGGPRRLHDCRGRQLTTTVERITGRRARQRYRRSGSGVGEQSLVGTLGAGLAGDGSFTYTPNPDFNGTDQFTYVANDGARWTEQQRRHSDHHGDSGQRSRRRRWPTRMTRPKAMT